MVSAISGSSPLFPASSSSSSNTVSPTAAADKDVNLLLQSSDVQQALASQTSSYLPAKVSQVLSTLWALFNTSGASAISEKDVEKALVSEGGKTSDAHALWVQLDPKGDSTIHAADFAFNEYLAQAIGSDLASLQTSITQLQQKQGPTSTGGMFGAFIALGGGTDIGLGSTLYFFA